MHDNPSHLFKDHTCLAQWEDTLHQLPSLLAGTAVQRSIHLLPPFPINEIESFDAPRLWRAQQLISFLAHAYIWLEGTPPPLLPASLSVPWVRVSKALDMPPILTYSTYNLLNWRRIDENGPIELGNICCRFNFNGGVDEEHFRLVHVAIEAAAGRSLSSLIPMIEASVSGNEEAVIAGLREITQALVVMQSILSRMGERCDPYIYYNRVRMPMGGWKGNALMPNGLIYEGVSQEPFQIYGETGAQSSIVPAYDAALGISHKQGWLLDYLTAMEGHMPLVHRYFVRSLRERGGGLRSYCLDSGSNTREAYNEAVNELEKFRSMHKGFAAKYIAAFSVKEKGTGGSDFMPALRAYQETTASSRLEE